MILNVFNNEFSHKKINEYTPLIEYILRTYKDTLKSYGWREDNIVCCVESLPKYAISKSYKHFLVIFESSIYNKLKNPYYKAFIHCDIYEYPLCNFETEKYMYIIVALYDEECPNNIMVISINPVFNNDIVRNTFKVEISI